MGTESDITYVIGSGPTGVACAKALLAKGRAVRMLDAGVMLEPDRTGVVARMAQTMPSGWTSADLNALKAGVTANTKGLPTKLVYGSDFPYQQADEHLRVSYQDVGLRPSLARGGLSNVWGAAMMPYRGADIADWPLSLADMGPHYEAILEFTGLSGRHDGLEPEFPLYCKDAVPLKLSRQGEILLSGLQRNEQRLKHSGIRFGQARVAIRASAHEQHQSGGCIYCGLCMYGCPYGHIYNSADTLSELLKNARFSYEPNVIVTRVGENSNAAQIEGYHRLTREPLEYRCNRAYLAAGAIPTTEILLRSKGLYERPVTMKDSQYFLFPLVLFRGAGDVRAESLHTLSQLFIEIMDSAISPRTVHLQIYSYSDLIGQAVAGAMGPLADALGFVARGLERRLLVVQGYIHSDHSPSILTTLKRGHSETPIGRHGENRNMPGDGLELMAQPNPEAKKIIIRAVRKLLRHATQIRAFPVIPMLQVAQVGRSFHSGGTFPMSARGGEMATDLLGRPFGWQRIHAVDATVLPSIPATTITFSVMANAHRIGTESAHL